jgi:hypothetical protein
VLPSSSRQKMFKVVVAYFSKTLVTTYQTAWRHVSKDPHSISTEIAVTREVLGTASVV